MSAEGILFREKCIKILDVFVLDKKESLMDQAEPFVIKTGDPFLRIKKKIGPLMNIEARIQTCWPNHKWRRRGRPNPQKDGSLQKKEGKGC